MARRYRVSVARDQYKFSCAHMTVFPSGEKERLHGHNYQIGVVLELSDIRFANMIPFADIKAALAKLCAAWKERVLVATNNPHFRLVRDEPDPRSGEYEFTLCGQRYVLPRGDVLPLPLDNIAVEPLAEHIAEWLTREMAAVCALPHVLALDVTVAESPGQSSSCTIDLR